MLQATMEQRMAFRSIMVHVDVDAHARDRIAVAADLAARFDALLIGVAAWPLRKSGALERSGVEYPPTEQALQDIVVKQLDELGASFRSAAGSNPGGVEWRSSQHLPNEVIAEEARAADLVVIGRDRLPGDVYHTFDPAAVILSCGRPVLMVPHGVAHVAGRNILVAWKDTREARRAVYDAQPFVTRAQRVSIVAVGPQELQERVREQVADVAGYLERHGAASTRQIVMSTREADSHLLLKIAQEEEADLIVAGAYGRSRLSEWIFGGVTRDLLTKSGVPCLFSN